MRPRVCLWKAKKIDGQWELEGLPLIIAIIAIVVFTPILMWRKIPKQERDKGFWIIFVMHIAVYLLTVLELLFHPFSKDKSPTPLPHPINRWGIPF